MKIARYRRRLKSCGTDGLGCQVYGKKHRLPGLLFTGMRLAAFLFLLGHAYAQHHNLFAQEKIIAIVNNDIITQKDLNDFINFTRVQLSAEYQGKQLEAKTQSLKTVLLDKLIDDRLILQEAKKNKIEIDKNRVKAKIEEIKKRFDSDTAFQESLLREGLVQADLESRIREQLLTYQIIDKKIRSNIFIAPSDVTDFYNRNIKEFIYPEEREFYSLKVSAQDLAERIYSGLKSGQTPEDAARAFEVTLNRFTAKKGQELRKDIERAVFRLSLRQVSRPVMIEGSYYIFILDKITPSKVRDLSEVQDKVYTLLIDLKMQEKLKEWLDELKKNAYIEIVQD